MKSNLIAHAKYVFFAAWCFFSRCLTIPSWMMEHKKPTNIYGLLMSAKQIQHISFLIYCFEINMDNVCCVFFFAFLFTIFLCVLSSLAIIMRKETLTALL